MRRLTLACLARVGLASDASVVSVGVMCAGDLSEQCQKAAEFEDLARHAVKAGNQQIAAVRAQCTAGIEHDTQPGRTDVTELGEVEHQLLGQLRQHFLHLPLKLRRRRTVEPSANGGDERGMRSVGNDSHRTTPEKGTRNAFCY